MAEETSAAAAAAEISPMAEEAPVPKEELAADETTKEEEEATETPQGEEEEEREPEAKEMDDHKRKLEDLEKKESDLETVEKTGETDVSVAEGDAVADSKRQKIDGNADGFGVDGIQEVQNIEAPVAGNGQLPLTEDMHPGSVEIPQNSEVVSQQDTIPSVGQEAPTSRKIEVPNNKVGVLIGKAGETIRNLQRNSGAQIQITRDAQADPNSSTRPVELVGTLEQINKAERLIKDVIAEAEAGGSPALIAQGHGATPGGSEVHEIQVPNEKVGMIIGKGGETIKTLQTSTGARIQLIPQHLPEGDVSKERTVRVTGNRQQIESAKEMIKEVMNKVPVRPSPLSGGHSRGYRPHGPGPVPQWGTRGPPPAQNQPQPTTGYDYQQRGMYPPQPTQYPQSYGGGYQQQQLAPRSNPSAGWDQRPGAPVQTPPGGGYNNYYGQGGQAMSTQQSNPVSTPNSAAVNYNYGNSQGTGYGQTNAYSQSGPSQQGYGPGYNEPRYDNQAPTQQVYGQQQPASSHPGFYPHQGSAAPQPGYAQQQPYSKPGPYSGGPQQSYGQPQGPVASYGSVAPTQQSQPYDSSAPPMQPAPVYNQTYGPPSGAVDGYNQPPPVAGYSQPGSQVASGYGQVGQPTYTQPGAQAAGYGQYQSTQPSYGEQPSSNNVNYGYQGGSADAGYGNVNPSSRYAAAPAVNSQPGYPQAGGYAQPAANPTTYDQQAATQYGYASQPGSVPVGYAKGVSPQPQPGGYGGWTA
ncbi:far upstream element-binding protein 1-like isoform X1 [Iris pallida]|uniref:Far upstream element-binding protein 1-like isoform X1 n=1 Tax=Iris pallida TaxID=29817 RepID=A0AAX6E3A7_IRIPA|nr:far upstream element-binding protein 1-like isoform X1 [Iris pallida]